MYIIKFEGKCDFILERIVVEDIENSEIKRIEFGSEIGDFYCEIKSNYSNEGKAIFECSKYLQKIITLILYETGYQIRNVELKSIQWDSEIDNATKTLVFRENINLKSTIKVIRPIKNPNELKLKIENIDNETITGFKKLFIEITNLNDPIVKYILYYSILTAIKVKQKKIDDYILTIEPDVEMRPTTREKSNFDETIYSFLRNQIGHTQETTNTDILQKEINENIEGLREIVKKAIEGNA